MDTGPTRHEGEPLSGPATRSCLTVSSHQSHSGAQTPLPYQHPLAAPPSPQHVQTGALEATRRAANSLRGLKTLSSRGGLHALNTWLRSRRPESANESICGGHLFVYMPHHASQYLDCSPVPQYGGVNARGDHRITFVL